MESQPYNVFATSLILLDQKLAIHNEKEASFTF